MANRKQRVAEHPFEGQLIPDFFNFWLTKGKLNDIDPTVHYSPPLADCTFIDDFINNQDLFPIKSSTGQRRPYDAALPEILLSELGCSDHLDRLSIFLARPNHRKGSVSLIFTHLYLQTYPSNILSF